MIYKTIGVCGGGIIGKCTILEALAEFIQAPPPFECLDEETKDSFEWARVHCLKVIKETFEVDFYTTSGVCWDRDKAFDYILSKSEAVIYVFAGHPKYDNSPEEEAFEKYTKMAKEKGKFWTDIPWIFVLNRIDWEGIIPPAIHLPPEFESTIIRTSAIKGIGIDLLWQRILEIVKS